MTAPRKIVIVGGGPAGVGAALAARAQDAAAEILLVSDEDCEPYEKPPLSKAVLTGKAKPLDAPIAGPGGIAAQRIVRKNAVVGEIDCVAHVVLTTTGERISYDALVLATGSVNRVLPMFPPGPGIYYLRVAADALALKAHLDRSRTLLIIGGGLNGLEVAASAAELGIATTVIEIAPPILSRVTDAEPSALIHQRHVAHGVDLRVGTGVAGVTALVEDRHAVTTTAGDTLAADLIVIGAGVSPEDSLAKAAGLATQDG